MLVRMHSEMAEAITRFIEGLGQLEPQLDDDPPLFLALHELVDLLGGVANPTPVFPAIFEFLEKYPTAEHGTPGPLVHLLETAYPGGYESLLMESLGRMPTYHTVWMVNRLLNGPDIEKSDRIRLLKALKQAQHHQMVDARTRDLAAEFLQFQGEPS